MPQRSNLSTRIFLYSFTWVGVAAIGCGCWTLIQSLRCQRWPTTQGVIASAEIERHSSSKGGDTYSARISYDYRVAGIAYTGTRLAFGAMSSSAAYAQGILDRFPVGKIIPVYYSTGDPQLAVLETGIHGGTWVCFGVGTVFVLAGCMFLKLFSSANPATPTTQANVGLQQPPILMGVICVVMGSFIFFMEPANGIPVWILYAAGGFFVLMGLFLLAYHLRNKVYSKILMGAAVMTLMALVHWVAFGPGERIGTTTSPFSQHNGVNVKSYFAVFAVFFDLILLAFFARRLISGRKD